MRSWSQPTESTCGLECSGEVKRLQLWSWAVLNLNRFLFLSPNPFMSISTRSLTKRKL
jgi:hypothetical protein